MEALSKVAEVMRRSWLLLVFAIFVSIYVLLVFLWPPSHTREGVALLADDVESARPAVSPGESAFRRKDEASTASATGLRVCVLRGPTECVEGAKIALFDPRRETVVLRSITDHEGWTDLLGAPTGDYFVNATAEIGGHKCDGSAQVSISDTEESYCVVVVRRGTGAAILSVVDDEQAPVSGARILVSYPHGTRQNVVTDDSGEVVLDGLQPGDYRVRMAADKSGIDSNRYFITNVARAQFEVRSDDVSSVKLTLPRTLRVRVRGHGEVPVSKSAVLELVPADGQFPGWRAVGEFSSSASPECSFYVGRGRYSLSVKIGPESVSHCSSPNQVFEVDGDVEVIRDLHFTGERGILQGIVQEVDGSPVEGALLHLRERAGFVYSFKDVLTGKDGRFLMRGIPLGLCDLIVLPDLVKNRRLAYYGTFELDSIPCYSNGDELSVIMNDGCSIVGVVCEQGSHMVLPGVHVAIDRRRFESSETTTTDENGVFRFDNLRPGAYRISAGDDGRYVGVAESVTVPGDSPAGNIRLFLRPDVARGK